MDRFRDKYRIPSARLQNWNYGWNASYFVTINTGGMAHHFGKIVQGKMHLSPIGQLAEKFWLEIPEHFPFVLLGVHQIMPNHMHGIITIHKTKINSQTAENGNNGNTIVQTPNLGVCTPSTETPDSGVSTHGPTHTNNAKSTNLPPHNTHNNKQTAAASQKWQPGTLGVIINQYKRICTINAHPINPKFAWHTRFYDHIIRNQAAYLRIKNYILNNPKNWEKNKNR